MIDLAPVPAMSDVASRPSRSLFQLAVRRFRRNRAAMAGLVVLALVTLISFLGPLFSNHSYDQVFASHVSVPPSLSPRPDDAALNEAALQATARAHVTLAAFAVSRDTYTATLTADTPMDPRVTRYIDRIDEFEDTQVTGTEEEGRRLMVSGRVVRDLFPFGTDANGRDLMVRVMLGGQVSILVGLAATVVSLGIGVAYGATAGFFGGRIDNIMMRLVEILYSLPFVFLIVVMVVFFGRSFVLMFIVIGAVEWLEMARIVRGQTLSIKRREYVAAAEALGVADRHIILRHIIPNSIGPIVIYVTVIVPQVMILESFLSFLGLGVQAPLTSWGALISEGAGTIQSAPWLLIFPSLFFVTTLFSLNFVGDGLRDALDPKDR